MKSRHESQEAEGQQETEGQRESSKQVRLGEEEERERTSEEVHLVIEERHSSGHAVLFDQAVLTERLSKY